MRIAARLTLASRSSASSATSKLRSSAFKFIRQIYIMPSIDWKNERGGAMVGGIFETENPPMSALANKKLIEEIFAAAGNPDSAARDRALFTASLAEDVTWTV